MAEDDMTAAIAKATEGLVNKRDELLGELKTAKEKLREYESLDLDALKGAAATLKSQEADALEKKGEFEKLRAQMREDHQKELEKLNKQLEAEKVATRGIIVDSALKSALASVNINPILMDSVTDMLSNKVAVTEKDNVRSANIGDKSVKDWVAEWAKTEVGKHFVLADSGSGAGEPHISNGNASKSVSKGDWDKKFDPNHPDYSMMDQALLMDENPDLYNTLIKKYEKSVREKLTGGYFRG